MLSCRVAVLCVLLYITIALISLCFCEKKPQLILEHATVTYVNPKYLKNFTISTKRYSRKDPNRYLSIYTVSNRDFDNKYSLYLYFYELLSNMYKPSFVSLHFDNYCEMIEKDTFFGSTLVAAYMRSTPEEKRLKSLKCPYPPGDYRFENMTIPYTPVFETFPFDNGRIVGNISYDKKDIVTSFYFDMILK